jgi:S-adenosylmethionine-diacylglycerol 3-amino-3-carboxypropyl transferase
MTADFSRLRYAQCWEDADVLLGGLRVRPGETCLSIGSAGDNAFALLARGARVVAVDLNPAQIALIHLKAAVFAQLSYEDMLLFLGHGPEPEDAALPAQRRAMYHRIEPVLPPDVRAYWDANRERIAAGVDRTGRFERYFALFRERLLPFVHSRATIAEALRPKPLHERRRFYAERWNTWRWRLLFRLFFSRFVMGRLGRDPRFFDYVEGSMTAHVMERARHGLVDLDPATNPYLQWILTGRHTAALPFAYRPENYEAIRTHLDGLTTHHGSIESYLSEDPDVRFDAFNLSDIFEYMSEEQTAAVLSELVAHANHGARLLYWNMLAPRSRPDAMCAVLLPRPSLAERLHAADKACFYSRIVIEEVA